MILGYTAGSAKRSCSNYLQTLYPPLLDLPYTGHHHIPIPRAQITRKTGGMEAMMSARGPLSLEGLTCMCISPSRSQDRVKAPAELYICLMHALQPISSISGHGPCYFNPQSVASSSYIARWCMQRCPLHRPGSSLGYYLVWHTHQKSGGTPSMNIAVMTRQTTKTARAELGESATYICHYLL
jgi:hypothetical protein